MKTLILLSSNLVEVSGNDTKTTLSHQMLGTILSNLAYYGYAPSKEVLDRLASISPAKAKAWWEDLEPVLKDVTGASRKMDSYVVYKNFPKEVLEMSEAQYWISQIFMYLGVPNEYFTQDEVERDKMFEQITLKVLHLAGSNSLRKICNELLQAPARWTKDQYRFVKYLVTEEKLPCDIASIVFKENMTKLVAELIKSGIEVNIKSATDVLRLAVGMSDGDVSLREKSKFRNFSRQERRFFLGLMDGSTSLEDDMGRRKNKWKKFMKALHPGDYAKAYPRVSAAYNKLYKNKLTTFNSKVEKLYNDADKGVLTLLQSRPGDYLRRLHSLIDLFGKDAATKFGKVLPNLSVIQLLKISKYVETINDRLYRAFPPRGNWTKLQVVENKRGMSKDVQKALLTKIDAEIAKRIRSQFATVNLADSAKRVKLQTNDSDLTNYGRGTAFPIPKNIKFIRSASYWQKKAYGNVWFDNGWNFFDANWNSVGVCCWTNERFGHGANTAAIFSGDPTNSKEMKGRACQMIDLYLDKLEESGVRYAVWNILCYSHIAFSQADDVFAAMQWGEEPQKGKLFEPSRCQLAFPVTGESMTKYIAYVDVKKREVVYMDANLHGDVSTAAHNGSKLAAVMPAFVEYLDALPSVHDVFKGVRKSKKGLPVSYDDADLTLDGGKAYIFKPVNEANKFEPIDISKLLV